MYIYSVCANYPLVLSHICMYIKTDVISCRDSEDDVQNPMHQLGGIYKTSWCRILSIKKCHFYAANHI